MENGLSKNIRSHTVFIKGLESFETEEIQITKTQYEFIKEDIANKKSTDNYTISDVDTKEILFDGQVKDILRFKEKKIGTSNYNVICSYGMHHPLINGTFDCDCKEKFGYDFIDLKIWARDKYQVMYLQDLTKEMRQEFKESIKLK